MEKKTPLYVEVTEAKGEFEINFLGSKIEVKLFISYNQCWYFHLIPNFH